MKNWVPDKHRIRIASQYIAAVVLSLFILCSFLKLYQADLKVPLNYNGDALLHAMFIRGIIDNGWYWQNTFIGTPGGLKMYDYPAVDNSAAVILALIALFSKNAILVLNVFYLLTFPLITVSSLYVFRQFNFSYVSSLFGSLLYTFLPYHFMRNEGHLFLSAYYFIPLSVMVLLWVTSDQLFTTSVAGQNKRGFNLRNRKFLISVVICVLVGSSGIYYPFFSCFLLLVAGISSSLDHRRLRPLGVAAILVAVTFTTMVINLSPSIVYLYKHGDVLVTQRGLIEPEIYGLKISQLLLPIAGHRVYFLNGIKKVYNENTLVTESDSASLGFLGSIGFLVLVAQLFFRKQIVNNETPASTSVTLTDLSVLNLFAVLLATIGGFGSLFAVLVSAGIRSYNRISVFIAFFSLMAMTLGLEWIYRRYVKSTKVNILFCTLTAFVLVLGILDQTSKSYVPDYSGIKAEYLSDDEFVNAIESAVPTGSMVFQLPYVPFPEHPRFNKMVDYDHFRGYLHSKRLRWSYGTMKNREGDLWQRQMAARQVEDFVQGLAFAGFSGIYLDRNGYEDNGLAKETELSNAIGVKPLVSRNGRLVFFNITDYSKRLRANYSEGEWLVKQESSLHPLRLDWLGGFFGLEVAAGKNWRWCSSEGELHIHNPSQRTRRIALEMAFATGHEQLDDLIISGSLLSEQLKITSTPSYYSRTISAPPGDSVIKFASTAQRVDAPLDPRVLNFRVEEFKMKELD